MTNDPVLHALVDLVQQCEKDRCSFGDMRPYRAAMAMIRERTGMNDIEYSWQSTPQLWMATRENYCGCGECSRGKYGIGKTKEEAAADLIEKEEGE